MTRIALGRQLVAQRQAHGLTQARLAELAGVHRTTISRIERGSWQATFDTMVRLAKALGVSLDVFADRGGIE